MPRKVMCHLHNVLKVHHKKRQYNQNADITKFNYSRQEIFNKINVWDVDVWILNDFFHSLKNMFLRNRIFISTNYFFHIKLTFFIALSRELL